MRTKNEKNEYEKRADSLIKELDKNVFNDLDEKETKSKKKETFNTTRISYEFDRLLCCNMPMTTAEAKLLPPQEYLNAYKSYCDVMIYINKYVAMKSTIQSFCLFAGILPETYNELLVDAEFSTVFCRLRGMLIDNAYVASQSGLFNSKAVITEMQNQNDGHGTVKAPELITLTKSNELSEPMILKKLESFELLTEKSKKTKK